MRGLYNGYVHLLVITKVICKAGEPRDYLEIQSLGVFQIQFLP